MTNPIEHLKVPENVKEDVERSYTAMKTALGEHIYPFLLARALSPVETMAVIDVATEIVVGGWCTIAASVDTDQPSERLQQTVTELRMHVTQLLTQAMKVVLANEPDKMAKQLGTFRIDDPPKKES